MASSEIKSSNVPTGGVIRKQALKPNLEDYEYNLNTFNWNEAKQELDCSAGGGLNVGYNIIDRHVKTWRKNKLALIWESKDGQTQKFSFLDIYRTSNQVGNLLRKLGIAKGDRVGTFLPRIPYNYIFLVALAKIGAVSVPMFPAFGPEAVGDRMKDSGAKLIVTNKIQKQRLTSLKKDLPNLDHIIVVDARQDEELEEKELGVNDVIAKMSDSMKVEETYPEDLLFIMYTSGTTGRPKGTVHVHELLLHSHMAMKWVLDLHDEDIYWCTSDPGWIVGVSYGTFGPWSNGATQVVYEGLFDAKVWYSIIEKHRVNVMFVAPTALRMLRKAGDDFVRNFDLSSLRHIACAGEPLNEEVIKWSQRALGLPVHDNWWQTEVGASIVSNFPSMAIKLGSMGRAFPGIQVEIVDDKGVVLPNGRIGNLAIKKGWPGMMRAIWNNEEKYRQAFYGEWYISGDQAFMDDDDYVWFIGRADDIIKTAGERVGPFEVESTLLGFEGVAEAAAIGKPDPQEIRGQIIKAFIVLKKGFQSSEELKKQIQDHVRKHLAAHAYPREIEFRESLPHTRSGKIMRRLLRAEELGQPLGDTSTLEEEA